MQINSSFNTSKKWPNDDENEIEAVPTNILELLKDEDKNGNQSKTFNKTYININGKTFDNMADATKYATDNVPALKLLKKLVKLDPFINSEINKMDNLVIDGEIIDNENINHTFDANQQINPNSRNLPKGASKTDLILGLIILALVFVVILYFIIQ